MIPDSWELPSYVAGGVYDMSGWAARRGPVPDLPEGNEAEIRRFPRGRKPKPKPAPVVPAAPATSHGMGNALAEIEPYVPQSEPAELYDQDDIDALNEAGFQPHDRNVWFKPSGDETGVGHYLVHTPGFKQGDRLRPWHLTTDPESTTGRNFRALRGFNGALKNLRMASVFPDWTKVGAEKTPAQIAAEKWLEDNSEDFEHWEPSPGDYTYPDVADAAGQRFTEHGDEPTAAGSYFQDTNRELGAPGSSTGHGHDHDDDEDYEPPEHEQHLADLGFNWEHRGDPDTTPAGEYQEGQYVRGQHDPEGNYIATHTIYRDPATNRWHVEHSPADTPDFVESHTLHQFPHDAISRYHHNAEQALLPQRGYEPHRGPSGAITHWTRIDTSPTGDEYHHEISHQPSSGEGYHQGFLGQTFGDHMNRAYAPNGTRNQNVEPDLADVVREHDRIGRGLHPGGAQDNRLTLDEFKSDPTVSRLGPISHISDNFYGDDRVGRAHWSFPHPEGGPHHVNAEAVYNWDKGGYDFKYTHDGNWLAATHNAVPAGAPVHVPGRQLSLPLGIDHPFNINDYRRP